MLHQINLPEYYDQLNSAVDFQYTILCFICNNRREPTLEELKSELGDEAAKWFWERLHYGGKDRIICTYLQKLIAYLSYHDGAAKRILEAFTLDRDFPKRRDDPGFVFRHSQLEKDDIEALKPLMVAFYETLFDSNGFPASIHHNIELDKLDRATWNDAFWDKNKKLLVCPSCDKDRPDVINGHISAHINHFFPKEKYPLLSINPDNLVPSCTECNSYAQGSLDPIKDHNSQPLLNTFLPYHRPAINHISVVGKSNDVGKFVIEIRERNGEESPRVERLLELLKLDERWADRMDKLINRVIASLKSQDCDEFSAKLSDQLEDLQQKPPGLEPNGFVYSQLLKYILENPDELESLWSVISSQT